MFKVQKSLGLMLPAMRISVALALLSACILLSAEMLGITFDEDSKSLEYRRQIAESMAIQFSVMEPQEDIEKIESLVKLVAQRNPDILSVAIRHASGRIIFQSPEHAEIWKGHGDGKSTASHVLVPLLERGELWGNIELRFKDLQGASFAGFMDKVVVRLALFCFVAGFFAYLVFMLRTLRQLDPSSVIPDRVNAAFDTLSEGVMIVDEEGQILLANKAFSERIDMDPAVLIGKPADSLGWKPASRDGNKLELPWFEALDSGVTILGAHFDLKTEKGETIKYAINASPIMKPDGSAQGVLVTLDDITKLEEQNVQLKTMINQLEKSQAKVQEQNKELTFLATRDALTGCLNRRSFSDNFKIAFQKARDSGQDLSCIMVDLDHFKQVNDNFGHSVGDEVIILLAEVLKASTRQDDLVGRYGGEEFCVVLPGMPLEGAIKVAERIRLRVKDEADQRYENDGPHVRASIGVASMADNPGDPSELNNFADEALYGAKENGRNRVVSYPSLRDLGSVTETTQPTGASEETAGSGDQAQVEMLQRRINELEDIASKLSSDLTYQESYDSLTGLPNQTLFHDRISQAIEHDGRQNLLCAVLVIDIEMFSKINASLGRSGGDELLKQVANRLTSIVRKSEGIARLGVSRFGGDEFAVLLTGIPKKDQVTWAIKRIVDEVSQPVTIGSNTIYLNCNVGVSLYPNDAQTVEQMLNNAMSAKKFCKTNKSEYGYHFYDPQVQEISVSHLHLEAELYRAIENQEWVLHYQPKLDLAQQKVTGVEALIRWNHPERGLLYPGAFIELAEQRGLIIKMGDWVILEACRQLQSWMSQGINQCKIAINVSSVQLNQSDIVKRILDYLDKFEVPPNQFEIEVTETILMENMQEAIASLQRLHARGISIAIDDFGTGYSSLNYLKRLPIDRLKIDRSFVREVCTDSSDQKIIKTLISMAHSMDIKVVAEGVETHEQFDLLKSYSIDEIQGNLISWPVAPGELEPILTAPINTVERPTNVVELAQGKKTQAG